jgi:hypothetical protein
LIESIRVVASHVEGIIDTESVSYVNQGWNIIDLHAIVKATITVKASTSPYFKGYFAKWNSRTRACFDTCRTRWWVVFKIVNDATLLICFLLMLRIIHKNDSIANS